jgi:hypothetical protein
MLPGKGLLMGNMAASVLSDNSVDTESQLFGIHYNNKMDKRTIIIPELKEMKTFDIIDEKPVYIVEKDIQTNERPYWVN